MNWYYVNGGQSVGPISEADLEKLVQSGTVKPETLVWNEAMTAWQPLSAVKPNLAGVSPWAASGLTTQAGSTIPGSAAAPAQSDEVICAECRKPFPRSDAVNLGNAWVCAACKPIFIQRIKEGAVSGAAVPGYGNLPSDPEELMKLIRERGYRIDIGSCLSRSWELLKNNFWLVVGATLLSSALQQAAGLVAFIPILGIFVVLALYGILTGGLYNFFIKLIRGQSGGVTDIFSGFGPRFVHLMLVPFIQGLAIGVFVLATVLLVAGGPLFQRKAPNPLLFLAIPVMLVPIIYLGLSWIFSLPLVIDRGLNFWPAMELSRKVVNLHWWTFFAMAIVGALMMFAGVLACLAGIFVAIPLFTGMIMYAYDDIFGSGRALGS